MVKEAILNSNTKADACTEFNLTKYTEFHSSSEYICTFENNMEKTFTMQLTLFTHFHFEACLYIYIP